MISMNDGSDPCDTGFTINPDSTRCCTTIDNAADGAIYTCTDETDSRISMADNTNPCEDGYFKNPGTEGTADTCVPRAPCSTITCADGFAADSTAAATLCATDTCDNTGADNTLCCNKDCTAVGDLGSGVVAGDSDGCTTATVLDTDTDTTCAVKCDESTHVARPGEWTCEEAESSIDLNRSQQQSAAPAPARPALLLVGALLAALF